MDTPPSALRDLATMEAPTNPTPKTPGVGPRRPMCLEIGSKWERPVVERRRSAYAPRLAQPLVQSAGNGLGTRDGKRAYAFFMNRRIPNGTCGGVGGRRG